MPSRDVLSPRIAHGSLEFHPNLMYLAKQSPDGKPQEEDQERHHEAAVPRFDAKECTAPAQSHDLPGLEWNLSGDIKEENRAERMIMPRPLPLSVCHGYETTRHAATWAIIPGQPMISAELRNRPSLTGELHTPLAPNVQQGSRANDCQGCQDDGNTPPNPLREFKRAAHEERRCFFRHVGGGLERRRAIHGKSISGNSNFTSFSSIFAGVA